MTDNIKKRDSLEIVIIINIIIFILTCFSFSVECLGEYRLMLIPLLWLCFIIFIILGVCSLCKSTVKIIKWNKIETWEKFETWENLKIWEKIMTWKITVHDIILIIFFLLFMTVVVVILLFAIGKFFEWIKSWL